jgi:hypothetical protein
MTRRRRGKGATLSPDDVPALREFARGYLHQDLFVEHVSVGEAVRAFEADASVEEREALFADLARLLKASKEWPEGMLARWFRDALGAAWAPESAASLADLIRHRRER